MKKVIYLSAIAAVALAGCTNDDTIVSNENELNASDGISFRMSAKMPTRAEHVGADAAALLGKNFVVEGWKTKTAASSKWVDANASVVFDNYNVNWGAATAGTTESNTADWEYVNQTKNALSEASSQEIKYWDHSALQYDFYAYSLGGGSATPTEETPQTAAIDASPSAYTISGTKEQLGKVYISDLVTVPRAKFNEEVTLSFRALAAKVRVAFYETIPGYSVRNLEFYNASDATSVVADNKVTLFSSDNTIFSEGTYKVFFPTVDDETPTTDKNKAHVSFTPAPSTGSGKLLSFTEAPSYQKDMSTTKEPSGKYLGISSTTATYTTADKKDAYEQVLPNETTTSSLTLRCNYTLVADDGTGEIIEVLGATAVVPAVYCQWKPNYAYTYLFKISDNTNGQTEALGTGSVGLHPITFDAVAVETEDGIQETVTTVATPSITTYSPGVQPTAKDEYIAGKTIYVMVQNEGTLKNDLNTKGQLYTLNKVATEAEVMDALNIQASSTATTITGRNGITLTNATSDATITAIPGADGNLITVATGTAASFTSAVGTYAYVYTVGDAADTDFNTAIIPDNGTDVSTGGYFTDFDCTTPATGTADGSTVYYQKITNKNTTYAVKVIKVVAATPAP